MSETSLALPRAVPRAARLSSRTGLLRWITLLVMGALLVGFALATPGFLLGANLGNIAGQSAVLGLLAFGMTIVVIAGGNDVVRGGIDLSVAANMGLCTALYATVAHAGHGDLLAVAALLAGGLAIGALNAATIRLFGVMPLLATLAVMNLAGGLELTLTRNTVVSVDSPLLTALSGELLAGLPWLAVLLALAALLFAALVDHAPFGLRLRAAGSHPLAARAAGIAVGRYVVASYLLSGLCAALAGLLQASLLSGSSPGSGDSLLPAVLTTLLGVTLSRRLSPSIGGTLLSVLFVGALANAFQLLSLSSYWVNGVEGVLILAVLTATRLARSSR